MKYKTPKKEVQYSVQFYNVKNDVETVICGSLETAQYCAVGLAENDDNRDIRVVMTESYPLSYFAK